MKVFDKNGNELELLEKQNLNDIFTLNASEWNVLDKNKNLNDISIGKYYAQSDDVINSLINKPSDFSITICDELYLIVFGINGLFIQMIFGGGSSGCALWLRRCSYGVFGNWTRL